MGNHSTVVPFYELYVFICVHTGMYCMSTTYCTVYVYGLCVGDGMGRSLPRFLSCTRHGALCMYAYTVRSTTFVRMCRVYAEHVQCSMCLHKWRGRAYGRSKRTHCAGVCSVQQPATTTAAAAAASKQAAAATAISIPTPRCDVASPRTERKLLEKS